MSNGVTFDYAGAHVVVTGGTSGIGRAIAGAFAAAGARVTITGTNFDKVARVALGTSPACTDSTTSASFSLASGSPRYM